MSSIIIILVILSVIVFLCNIFCIMNIIYSRQLRWASHIAICSLLFAHLIQGVLVIPSYAMKRSTMNDKKTICDVFRFSYMLTNYGACISLLLVTLDRLFAILYPLRYSLRVTVRNIISVLCVCWLYVLSLCMIPFFTVTLDRSCTYNPRREWTIFMLIFNTFIPFVIVLVSYVMIFAKTKKTYKVKTKKRTGQFHSHKKFLKTTVLIVVSFIICWGPSFVYYFLQSVCQTCLGDLTRQEDVENIMTFLMKVLTLVDGIIAPLIYCFLNRKVNAEMQSTIRRLRAHTDSSRGTFTVFLTAENKVRKHSSPLLEKLEQKVTLHPEISVHGNSPSPKIQNECGTTYLKNIETTLF